MKGYVTVEWSDLFKIFNGHWLSSMVENHLSVQQLWCSPYVGIRGGWTRYWLCLGGRSPEAYGSRVFVCVSAESFPELVLRVCWKLSTETCNASLTQYYLEMKLVDFGLVALLWSYGMIYVQLLTLTAVFHCPESVKEQAAYKGLLFNLVVPSLPQGRQWAKLNQDPGHRRYTGYFSQPSQRGLVLGTCPDGRWGPVPRSSNYWRHDSIA